MIPHQAGIIRQLPDYSSVIGNRQLKPCWAIAVKWTSGGSSFYEFVSIRGWRKSNIAPVMTLLEVNAGDRIICARASGLDG